MGRRPSLKFRSKRASEKLSKDSVGGLGYGKAPEKDALKMYLDDLKRIIFLTRREQGYAPREKLIESVLRYVVSLAVKWWGLREQGFLLEDLIGEGNVGVVLAADRYVWNKGSFITYSSRWIKQCMRQAVMAQCSATYIPYRKIERILRGEAEADLYNMYFGESLDRIIEESGEGAVGATESFMLDDRLHRILLEEAIDRVLEVLDEHLRDLLCRRFGLRGHVPETLANLGRRYGISPETVRQHQHRAIAKIRPLLEKAVE